MTDNGLTLANAEAEAVDTDTSASGLYLTLDPSKFMLENLPRVQCDLDNATTPAQVAYITNLVATPIQLAAQQAQERIQLEAQAKLRAAQEAQSGLATASAIPILNRSQRRSLR
jgi:hypothetical protein